MTLANDKFGYVYLTLRHKLTRVTTKKCGSVLLVSGIYRFFFSLALGGVWFKRGIGLEWVVLVEVANNLKKVKIQNGKSAYQRVIYLFLHYFLSL